MSHDGDQIKVGFCPVPLQEVQAEISLAGVSTVSTSNMTNSEEPGERSKFGPRPQFDNPNFDFQQELK